MKVFAQQAPTGSCGTVPDYNLILTQGAYGALSAWNALEEADYREAKAGSSERDRWSISAFHRCFGSKSMDVSSPLRVPDERRESSA